METFYTLCFGSLACVVLAVLVAIGQRRFERWWFRRTQPRDWHDRTGPVEITEAGGLTHIHNGERRGVDFGKFQGSREIEE